MSTFHSIDETLGTTRQPPGPVHDASEVVLVDHSIRSMRELLDFEDWEGSRVRLVPLNTQEVWRAGNRKPLEIKRKDNFEIDGGEGGLTLYGTGLFLKKCNNVRLRNLTIRLGAKGFTLDLLDELKDDFPGWDGEALKLEECTNVHVSNCAFSWGLDETFSVEDSKDILFEYNLVTYPIDAPEDKDGDPIYEEHDKHHAYPASTRGSKRVVYGGCVFAHSQERSPQFSPQPTGKVQGHVLESLIFDFSDQGTKLNGEKVGEGKSSAITVRDNFYVRNEAQRSHALVVDRPDHTDATVTVSFGRNVVRRRGGSWKFMEEVDVRNDSGKGEVIIEDGTLGYPQGVTFESIINAVGPEGVVTRYTQEDKDRMLRDELTGVLEHREPRRRDWQGTEEPFG